MIVKNAELRTSVQMDGRNLMYAALTQITPAYGVLPAVFDALIEQYLPWYKHEYDQTYRQEIIACKHILTVTLVRIRRWVSESPAKSLTRKLMI